MLGVKCSMRSFCTSRMLSAARVAVVGSGPAGLFTCTSLIRRVPSCIIDVFDAAPVPFGLVRYGVAPDHQEVKNCIHGFEKLFNDHAGKVKLFCNTKIGKDVSMEELLHNYDSVLLAYGAHRPRKLNIPGSNAGNVFSGSDFVSWYNGVPHARAPLLDKEKVVIIGNGNVALDCARILCSRDNLLKTDIPDNCLKQLLSSKVSNVSIIGRRGPENVSFTIKELREQFKVPKWKSVVALRSSEKEALLQAITNGERRRKRLLQVLLDNADSALAEENVCTFLFNRVPIEICQSSDGRIKKIRVKNVLDDKIEELECDLLIYSIGYESLILDGLPVNEKGGLKLADECQVDIKQIPVFAAGWCSHGARGVIVDTQQQAMHVAQRIADVLPNSENTKPGVESLLADRNVRFVTWSDWKQIDERERLEGQQLGKVREKMLEFESLFSKS